MATQALELPRLAVDQGLPTVRLIGGRVVIDQLEIRDKAVVDFVAQVAEDERENCLLEAIQVGAFCLERASAARDMDYVRAQIDSMMNEVDRRVQAMPNDVEELLAQKLNPEDGPILAPIKNTVNSASMLLSDRLKDVRQLLTEDLDPGQESGKLGSALRDIRNLLDDQRNDSIQATLSKAVEQVTGEDGRLAKSVKVTVAEATKPLAEEIDRMSKQIAAGNAAQEVINTCPKKGLPYEEDVLAAICAATSGLGPEVTHVGPDAHPGDIIVRFGEASAAPGLCIVVEAKNKADHAGMKVIGDSLSRAMRERNANAGIYLSKFPDGLAVEINGWREAEGDRGHSVATTFDHLVPALRFLLLLHRMDNLREYRISVDLPSIEQQLDRIRNGLKRVAIIKKHVTTTRGSVGKIQDEAEELQQDVHSSLLAIEEKVQAAESAAMS